MATYTTELKRVIENIFGSVMDPDEFEQTYHSVEFKGTKYDRLPIVPDWSKIGLGTYPIFDEDYRDILNGKIVDEYFNREIGTETVDNFLLILRKRMDQIMPYYNKLYMSETIEFDPLATIDITTSTSSNTDETGNSTGNVDTTSETKSGSRSVAQELPQTMLSGNGEYATSATDANADTNVTGGSNQVSNSQSNVDSTGESHSKGFQGVASDLLMRYRNSLLNIDVMVLGELNECFMLILNNGSAYAQRDWYF